MEETFVTNAYMEKVRAWHGACCAACSGVSLCCYNAMRRSDAQKEQKELELLAVQLQKFPLIILRDLVLKDA